MTHRYRRQASSHTSVCLDLTTACRPRITCFISESWLKAYPSRIAPTAGNRPAVNNNNGDSRCPLVPACSPQLHP